MVLVAGAITMFMLLLRSDKANAAVEAEKSHEKEEAKAEQAEVETTEWLVTPFFQGRLGNQLFQVAAAYAYAREHGKTLVIDLPEKEKPNTPKLLQWAVQSDTSKVTNWNDLSESSFAFSKLPAVSGHVKLKGYFQSSNYFGEYRDVLLEAMKGPFHEQVERSEASVSIHIRRGDYVGSATHTCLSQEYYLSAIQTIRSETGLRDLDLYIFSDDLDWCRMEMVHWPWEDVRVHYVTEGTDEDQLVEMSCCRHHIMSASSFSWWGSYLSKDQTGITVAPKQWFHADSEIKDWSTIYEPHWILL